nr:MAG TPA_asm: hypothetical protein [Caudoviricetes sp.]
MKEYFFRAPKKIFRNFFVPPWGSVLGSRFHFHGFLKTCNKRANICDIPRITQIHHILCYI